MAVKMAETTQVRDHDAREQREGLEASKDTVKKRTKPRSSQEPQPPKNTPEEYNVNDHAERSAVRKANQAHPLHTMEGVHDYKQALVVEEGSEKEPPVPRGLPFTGDQKRGDERKRGLVRSSDLNPGTVRELETEEEVVLVELCPPLKTFANLRGELYKQEEAPFRVNVQKAKELFALRNDLRQPLFRNYRPPQPESMSRTSSGRMVREVEDEEPIVNKTYEHILRRQRPNAQADEDEVVLTQRGLVSKGRRDVDYGEVDGMDNRDELASRDRTPRRRASDQSVQRNKNSGDLSSADLRGGGGVKV